MHNFLKKPFFIKHDNMIDFTMHTFGIKISKIDVNSTKIHIYESYKELEFIFLGPGMVSDELQSGKE